MRKFEGLKLNKPVDPQICVITGRFWSVRRRPGRWRWGLHFAYDFAPDPDSKLIPLGIKLSKRYCEAKVGVYSSAEVGEEVVKVDYEPDGFGKYVKTLINGFPIYLYYAHLQDVHVERGQIIMSPGQQIGVMGATGFVYSTTGGDGCHLHHEGREIITRDQLRPIDLAHYYKPFQRG